MAQTTIPVGSDLARKVYGAALFARIIQAPSFHKSLIGPAPGQGEAESKLKGQTAPTMPVVRVTDLSKANGDKVSVDMFDTVNGEPLIGDRNAEGTGEKLSSSSMDVRIDLLTKGVDAGGKMANQRTIHNLRGIAMAQLEGYFTRLYDQLTIVHAAGARGSMTGRDWILPKQWQATTGTTAQANFADILVNDVKAPSYNRHFVVDTASTGNIIQGGAQLASVGTGDIMDLNHIDTLSLILDDLEQPIPPVKIADDPAANDEPIKAVLWVTPRQWWQMKTTGGTSNVWRTFLQNAWVRKSYGSKHPLFSGEPGLWNGILVRQLPRYTVRFVASERVKHITAANRYAGTETDVTVNSAMSTTHAVERAILMGGQALAMVYGKNAASGGLLAWHERPYNLDRALEVFGDAMFGMAKLRFNYTDSAGNVEPTDYSCIAVDSVVPL